MSFRSVVLFSVLAWGCGAGTSAVPDAAVRPDGMPAADAHTSDAHHVDAAADASRDAFRAPDARNTFDAPLRDAPGVDAPDSSCSLSGGIVCATGATCGPLGCSQACTSTTCPGGTACGPSGWCFPTSCGASAFQYCFVSATDTGMCCSGTCVDIDTDPNNCSFCNTPCSSGGPLCVRGQCTTPPQDCATAAPGSPCLDDGGLGTCCGPGACRPTASFYSDSQNCNGCGNICPDGGVCSDEAATDTCGQDCTSANPCGAGTMCVLGNQCLTTACGASSALKPCALTSEAAGVCCGSTCADALTDDQNCGSCGNACGAGSFCQAGQCVAAPTCAAGNTGVACRLSIDGGAGTCCAGACATGFDSDPSNCGACGVACPTGDTCVSGRCQGSSVTCPAGTALSNNGTACAPAACPSGATGVACAFSGLVLGVCCDGACADLYGDPANCGACGAACPSGACSGECVPEPAAATASCTSPDVPYNDPALGPECATSCPIMPPLAYCAIGSELGVCCAINEGFDAPSVCVDLANDPKNCGGCLIACPGSETCAGGVCSGATAACGAGHSGEFCDLADGPSWLCCGGACTNTSTDANNCGECGFPCGGTLTCVDGDCQ